MLKVKGDRLSYPKAKECVHSVKNSISIFKTPKIQIIPIATDFYMTNYNFKKSIKIMQYSISNKKNKKIFNLLNLPVAQTIKQSNSINFHFLNSQEQKIIVDVNTPHVISTPNNILISKEANFFSSNKNVDSKWNIFSIFISIGQK